MERKWFFLKRRKLAPFIATFANHGTGFLLFVGVAVYSQSKTSKLVSRRNEIIGIIPDEIIEITRRSNYLHNHSVSFVIILSTLG